MLMNTMTRRWAAWAACIAILMAALAPSVSHALARARGVDIAWMEVCSTTGLKVVQAASADGESGAPSSSDGKMQAAQCPFCSTHAAVFLLPPSAVRPFPLAGNTRLLPSLFYQSPAPQFIWSSASSRGPPALS